MTGQELREKSLQDLRVKERELTEQLFKLRFQNSVGSAEKPSKIREVKREIARVKTVLGEKARESAK